MPRVLRRQLPWDRTPAGGFRLSGRHGTDSVARTPVMAGLVTQNLTYFALSTSFYPDT